MGGTSSTKEDERAAWRRLARAEEAASAMIAFAIIPEASDLALEWKTNESLIEASWTLGNRAVNE